MNPFNHIKYIKSIAFIMIMLIIGVSGETTRENSQTAATDTPVISIQAVTSTDTQ